MTPFSIYRFTVTEVCPVLLRVGSDMNYDLKMITTLMEIDAEKSSTSELGTIFKWMDYPQKIFIIHLREKF